MSALRREHFQDVFSVRMNSIKRKPNNRMLCETTSAFAVRWKWSEQQKNPGTPWYFQFYLFIFWREGKGGRKKGREAWIGCLSSMTCPGAELQPRRVCCPGISWWPFALQDSTQVTKPHQSGQRWFLKNRTCCCEWLEVDRYFWIRQKLLPIFIIVGRKQDAR